MILACNIGGEGASFIGDMLEYNTGLESLDAGSLQNNASLEKFPDL